MIRAVGATATHEGYIPGFGNDFETEALPGALLIDKNSPQNCNFGQKFEMPGRSLFHTTEIGQIPHSVVAWHANYAPYKYDRRNDWRDTLANIAVCQPRAIAPGRGDALVGKDMIAKAFASTACPSTLPAPMTKRAASTHLASGPPTATARCGNNFKAEAMPLL